MDFKTKTIRETKDSSIPLLNIYPKNPKTLHQKDLCIHIFIAALFTVAKIWKQLKCPLVVEWIEKTVVLLHDRMLQSCKKEGNLTFCESMDGP